MPSWAARSPMLWAASQVSKAPTVRVARGVLMVNTHRAGSGETRARVPNWARLPGVKGARIPAHGIEVSAYRARPDYPLIYEVRGIGNRPRVGLAHRTNGGGRRCSIRRGDRRSEGRERRGDSCRRPPERSSVDCSTTCRTASHLRSSEETPRAGVAWAPVAHRRAYGSVPARSSFVGRCRARWARGLVPHSASGSSACRRIPPCLTGAPNMASVEVDHVPTRGAGARGILIRRA